ncbi:hypothetical protein VNO78_21410 [Psophocarpus tetragonolobus]|uniref:VQ domain-containing protein n=1 Tax=Psophocarpus tetragonolobus TaxID=3891 RepID=A0AAN9SD95_PSOTE
MDSYLSKTHGFLKNEREETLLEKDEVSYKELCSLMRIRDFISLLLASPMKIEEKGVLKSWIIAFPKWKAQLLSTNDDSMIDKPWCVHTQKALRCVEGFFPMEMISQIQSGEGFIFNHSDEIPEVILHLAVDLAVNQLIQTLFSRDYYVRYIKLSTRNLAEKESIMNNIVAALEDKHNMFGFDKDFLRTTWINVPTYGNDIEVEVQEMINTMMKGFLVSEDDDMLHKLHIEGKVGTNRHLVIVVDSDNKRLDLQKVCFPTGIVVMITTESSTQAGKDNDFRIACTIDLNIRTRDHLLTWEVLCSYVGNNMIYSSMAIQRIAVKIVMECHGHLLAIILVAKYLASVKDVTQWELALDKLTRLNPFYNYQYSDRIGINRVMVNAFANIVWEEIDDVQKLCLELCLHVQNIKNVVSNDILVSHWAEILLGNKWEFQYYIHKLLDRFVLLKYESEDVYLPIETYDIIKSLHTLNPSIIRHGALGLTKPTYIGQWHSLVQIELMDNKICELPQSPDCPKLKVLLLQGNVDLMDIPDSFFSHMPLLQHLDLSYTSIRDLPPSISTLIQLKKFYLRGCDLFMELPPQMGQLTNLVELDLDETLITYLPKEIKELINLQSLILCFDGYHHVIGHSKKDKQISRPTIIHSELISNLTKLKCLSINIDPEDERWNENVNTVLMEICVLQKLKMVSIYIPNADIMQFLPTRKSLNFKLVVGHHVQRFISRVTPELVTKFKHCDNSIKFVNGVDVPIGVKMNLERFKALFLDRHMTIKSLSDFDLKNLWGLKVCILAECNEMETIVNGSNSLDRPTSLTLEFLSVFYMKNLRSICEGHGCFFLYLKSMTIHTCPMLTTIFTLDSLNNLSFLEEIIVEDCPKVTTLISYTTPEQKSEISLPKLKIISLLYLPELINIFNGLNVTHVLEEVIFYYCPKLESLSKSELTSKSLKIIRGENMWWEALKWNVEEWGHVGRPKYFEIIFSPIIEEFDMMKQLVSRQETRLNEYHEHQEISSSIQLLGSSKGEVQKRKVVAESERVQEEAKKMLKTQASAPPILVFSSQQVPRRSTKRELRLEGPRPPPLMVSKESHKIRKPPLEHRKPVINHDVPTAVLYDVSASEFLNVVQRLTGLSATDKLADEEKARGGDDNVMLEGVELRRFPGILSPATLPPVSPEFFLEPKMA